MKGSELVCNYFMHMFEDCIGLWVGGTCNHCLNSIGLKEFLKLDSGEFSSLVMKTDEGSWVVTEPQVMEGLSHGAAFFIRNNNQHKQVSAWINHS